MTRTYTLAEIEEALDGGFMQVLMANGNYWRLRRNGKTQLWRTRPGHFRIPVKFGIRGYGELTHHDCQSIGRPGDGPRQLYMIDSMVMGRAVA